MTGPQKLIKRQLVKQEPYWRGEVRWCRWVVQVDGVAPLWLQEGLVVLQRKARLRMVEGTQGIVEGVGYHLEETEEEVVEGKENETWKWKLIAMFRKLYANRTLIICGS